MRGQRGAAIASVLLLLAVVLIGANMIYMRVQFLQNDSRRSRIGAEADALQGLLTLVISNEGLCTAGLRFIADPGTRTTTNRISDFVGAAEVEINLAVPILAQPIDAHSEVGEYNLLVEKIYLGEREWLRDISATDRLFKGHLHVVMQQRRSSPAFPLHRQISDVNFVLSTSGVLRACYSASAPRALCESLGGEWTLNGGWTRRCLMPPRYTASRCPGSEVANGLNNMGAVTCERTR